jgi:hypothetical protein
MDAVGKSTSDNNARSQPDSLWSVLWPKGRLLAAAALDGGPPLVTAFELSGLRPDSPGLRASLDNLNQITDEILHLQGFVRFRGTDVTIAKHAVGTYLYYRPAEEELFRAVDDPHPLLSVVTLESQRFTRALIERHIKGNKPRPLMIWTRSAGLHEVTFEDGALEFKSADTETSFFFTGGPNIGAVFSYICDDAPANSIILMQDCDDFLTPPISIASGFVSELKDVYYRLRRAKKGVKLVIFTGSHVSAPELREELQRIELSLPGRRELSVALEKIIRKRNLSVSLLDHGPNGYVTRLVDSAAGMTLGEVYTVIDAFARSGESEPLLLLNDMREAKKKSVARSPALEIIDEHGGADIELGGLERLTAWLDARRKVFEHPEAARAAGIDRRPKGVLLLGIPGTGKSMAAKAVARHWGLPLLRFDLGAVHHHYVGSSEARMRQALQTATAMAPCVLWIDEIEKGIAQGEGLSANSVDMNIRATLLTWMQEFREPVFIIATANRISQLPPELMRAGRFDARFFLGCPNPVGRERIFEIHLKKRKLDNAGLDIGTLVAATHGYTGAEIEQLVLDALYDAFNESTEAKVTMEHFTKRLRTMQPLIKTIGSRGSGQQGQRGQLDEVWDLIEEGRVEPASDFLLTRTQVAKLIDPLLFQPMYCRKERLGGFDKLHAMGERMVMRAPLGGPAAAILDPGDADWIYVHTNIRYDQLDQHDFKFLDRISTIEDNDTLAELVTQFGVGKILFADPVTRQRLEQSEALGQFADLFEGPSD